MVSALMRLVQFTLSLSEPIPSGGRDPIWGTVLFYSIMFRLESLSALQFDKDRCLARAWELRGSFSFVSLGAVGIHGVCAMWPSSYHGSSAFKLNVEC